MFERVITAKAVQLGINLWGVNPGGLAGRLCNLAVTVADRPAKVENGALLN
ncbi:DUF2586 family protein, partial [Salmonella enterica]|uniref:DUF2586 family protein n=1 Tax=Salmonella enterica TaxID=28901 RepID=UPI00398C3465